MQHFKFLLLLFLACSCQFFETEKIGSETFYQEELKSIDWRDVDQYPSFANCENTTEKAQQKSCFENTLANHLKQAFGRHKAIAVHDLNDTVKLSFSIDNRGKLKVNSVNMSATLEMEFPFLDQWLMESIDTLQPVAPAYKRGIPVATQFTLPIIIKTEDL